MSSAGSSTKRSRAVLPGSLKAMPFASHHAITSGRLRAQIGSAVGQPPAGELERRVAAQSVEIVGTFVAAGDRENPSAQNIGQPMDDPARITLVRDHPGEPLGNAEPMLRLGEQHDAAIRANASNIKGGS